MKINESCLGYKIHVLTQRYENYIHVGELRHLILSRTVFPQIMYYVLQTVPTYIYHIIETFIFCFIFEGFNYKLGTTSKSY